MKKYLLALILLFLWHAPAAHAQWLFPSGAGCQAVNAGAGATVACTASNTLGRAQIVAAKWCDTDTTCTVSTSSDTYALADTVGNTYGQCQRLDSASGTDRRAMVVCIAQNIGANVSNAVTLTVTSGNAVELAGLIVTEISGGTATVTADASGTTDLAAAASPITVTTSGVLARGNELIYTWVNLDGGTLSIGPPVTGGMGTNYANRSLGAAAIDQWNNAAPRTFVKSETMTYNSSGNPQPASQQQRGIIVTYYSPAQLAPTTLTFNAQSVSTTATAQPITFTNTGLSNIFISAITFAGANAGDFAISGSSTCAASVNVGVGTNCNLLITFTPTGTGARTATVRFFTSASGSPHIVSLTGTGI